MRTDSGCPQSACKGTLGAFRNYLPAFSFACTWILGLVLGLLHIGEMQSPLGVEQRIRSPLPELGHSLAIFLPDYGHSR